MSIPISTPSEETIRQYAYQLYELGNRRDGHAVDNWTEAVACLQANIPPHLASTRLHWYLNCPGSGEPSLLSVEARVLAS